MDLTPKLQLSTDQLAHAAWDMVKKHWKLLIGAPAITMIVYGLIGFGLLYIAKQNGLLALIVGLGWIVVVTALYTASIKWSEQAFNGNTPDLNTGIEAAKKNTLRVLTTGLLTGIKIILWSILLLIPGIYFKFCYFFSPQIAAIEGITHGKANQISKELVLRSGIMRTVGNVMAIGFVIYICSLISMLILMIVSAIFMWINTGLGSIIVGLGSMAIFVTAGAVLMVFINFLYFAYKQEIGGLPKTEVVVEKSEGM